MRTISLKEFALTGRFGPVTVGMSKEQLLALLGPPESDNDFGTGWGGLRYGSYEFFYELENGLIASMQNDHLQANCDNHGEMILFKNEAFTVDPWFLEAGRDFTYAQVIGILKGEKITFQEEKDRHIPFIRFASGVTLDFDNRDGVYCFDESGQLRQNREVIITLPADFVLNGIRYFP